METNKLNKFNISDFLKENSGGPRLQSLRLPRDLSLGGSKLPKKVYKPNLNAVRNKEKTREVLKKERGTKQSHRESFNLHKQRFVQSTGVFSDGIGDAVRIPEKRISITHVEKPNLNINKLASTVNIKKEVEITEYLSKYEDDSEDDSKDANPFFAPINWCKSDFSKDLVDRKVKLEYSSSILRNENGEEEISNCSPSMTLWQVPDSFGILNEIDKKLVDSKLTNLPEGKIGKLCIRKSGKVDVFIGNIRHELEPAQVELFTEEIVFLDAQKSAATVLNKIENRFVLNPSWQHLLR